MFVRKTLRYRLYKRALALVDNILSKIFLLNLGRVHENRTFVSTAEDVGDFHKVSKVFTSRFGWLEFNHRGTKSDFGVIKQIFEENDYDLSRFSQGSWVQNRYNVLISAGKIPTIVDAGANIGLASIYFNDKFPEARVISIEPSKSNYDLLLLNTSAFNVECLHAALGSSDGILELFDRSGEEWAFSTFGSATEDQNKKVFVTAISMTSLMEKRIPFILKIDIEGAEKDLFENVEIFDQFALIIIELHDWLYPAEKTSSSFLNFVARSNFDFVHRGENIFLFNREFA